MTTNLNHVQLQSYIMYNQEVTTNNKNHQLPPVRKSILIVLCFLKTKSIQTISYRYSFQFIEPSTQKIQRNKLKHKEIYFAHQSKNLHVSMHFLHPKRVIIYNKIIKRQCPILMENWNRVHQYIQTLLQRVDLRTKNLSVIQKISLQSTILRIFLELRHEWEKSVVQCNSVNSKSICMLQLINFAQIPYIHALMNFTSVNLNCFMFPELFEQNKFHCKQVKIR
eukprot:TRINITY_DN8413_c0_g1_i2.p2 TRINITY_DN8413_c0_g1~~TRINITY_DN8413_c0_g1_i2.p2  ORF type:complete len:223 (-),score=-15.04 TRINITY_DN8413_c0_g1_i2:481-1149(-)